MREFGWKYIKNGFARPDEVLKTYYIVLHVIGVEIILDFDV